MSAGIDFRCGGHRPWLGPEGREECEEDLRLPARTASNSYFSQVVSALSVPEPGRELEEAVRAHGDVLEAATPETLPAFRSPTALAHSALLSGLHPDPRAAAPVAWTSGPWRRRDSRASCPSHRSALRRRLSARPTPASAGSSLRGA